MKPIRTVLASAALALAAALSPAPASAQQQISDAQLQAAMTAMLAAEADQDFNAVLPEVAFQIQALLIERRPDLYVRITEVVLQVAAELIPRRLDLNNEVARIWAETFTMEELNAITAFYQSPVGLKLLEVGPALYVETFDAMTAWSDRLAEEMLERSLAVFEQQGADL